MKTTIEKERSELLKENYALFHQDGDVTRFFSDPTRIVFASQPYPSNIGIQFIPIFKGFAQ